MSINERENINEENSQEERRRRQDVFNSGLRRIGSFANLPNRGILRILPTIRTELMLNRTAENFGEYLSVLLFLIDNSIERHTNLIGDMRNRIVPANERRERKLINNIPRLKREINYIRRLYREHSGAFTDNERDSVAEQFGELRSKVSELSNKNLKYNFMAFKNSLKAIDNKLSCQDVDCQDVDSRDARIESRIESSSSEPNSTESSSVERDYSESSSTERSFSSERSFSRPNSSELNSSESRSSSENGVELVILSSSEEDERESDYLRELTTLNSELSSSTAIGL